MTDDEVVDVHCPGVPRGDGRGCFPGRLLLRLRQRGEQPTMIQPNNLMELYCEDCTRAVRKAGRKVKRVLHRYDYGGFLVETLLVKDDSSDG